MAKSTGARTTPSALASPTQDTDTRLEAFAEDLGRLLGEARNKADSWLAQREAIVKHLEGVRDTATHLLEQLRGGGARPAATRGPGRRPKAVVAGAAGGGHRTMSAEARAKIAAAQRARWARVRKTKD